MLATKPKREVEGVYQKLLSRFIYANAKSNQKLAHFKAAKDRYNHHYAKGKPTIFYLRYLLSFVKSIILKIIKETIIRFVNFNIISKYKLSTKRNEL